ncbi:MAG: FecR domain-containing protein [Campylobacterota bacterium]|nr:FecR domain-containing protein [Campylobacterota bacterium]
MKILIFLLLSASVAMASVGNITSFKGSVSVSRDSAEIRAKIHLPIEKSDVISTKNNSNAIIKFNDNTIVTIGKKSSLIVEDYVYDSINTKNSKTQFNFIKGTFKCVTGIIGDINSKNFKLKTNSALLGIRGTVTLGDQKLIACTKGSINVESKGKSVVVNAGEYVETIIGKKPSDPKVLTKGILSMINNNLLISGISSGNSNKKDSRLKVLTNIVEKSVEAQKEEESDGDSGHGH